MKRAFLTRLSTRSQLSLFVFSLVLLNVSSAASAATFVIEARNDNTFRVIGGGATPNITIQVGDSITFRNAGGFHNVEWDGPGGRIKCANGCADQGGDGSPSTAAWEFTRQFNTAGTLPYVCIVHEAIGMVGTITIEGAAETGSVSFTSASFSEPEDGGNAVITLRRVGGSDGTASVRMQSSNGSATAGADYTAVDQIVNWADGDDANKSVTVSVTDDNTVEANETVTLALSQPQGATLGGPTSATLTIIDNDASQSSIFRFDTATYDHGEADGTATATVRRTGGSSGAVSVDYATSDGTATAGQDYTATSGTLNWNDGDSSNKTFEITIIDDADTEDMESFAATLQNATGDATIGSPGAATVNLADNDFAACEVNETTICILEDRFQVRVFFEDPTGNNGFANAGEFTPESGFFTFFTADNVEVLVKAIDACGPFDRFWIFAAGLTDVKVRIEVTDTETGTLKTYNNPQGTPFDPVLDIDAFATCP